MRGDVRGVVFDAVGTLIHPEPAAARVYAEMGRRHGSNLTAEQIALGFVGAFQKQEEKDRQAGWHTSEERERQRWREIVLEVLPDTHDPEKCFDELFEHFAGGRNWRCEAGIAALREQLQAAGYPMGLASNYDRRLRRVLEGLPALRQIAHVIISAEVGWRKPAEEFFQTVTQTMALPAQELLYVGDDLFNDYHGALQAGFQAVLFDPMRKVIDPQVKRIERLEELV